MNDDVLIVIPKALQKQAVRRTHEQRNFVVNITVKLVQRLSIQRNWQCRGNRTAVIVLQPKGNAENRKAGCVISIGEKSPSSLFTTSTVGVPPPLRRFLITIIFGCRTTDSARRKNC
ncbi:hypothetical protein M0804_006934 [Polistes exclamans]|nr:hypothetical protein M0804_006934 [Polistes exclamans]